MPGNESEGGQGEEAGDENEREWNESESEIDRGRRAMGVREEIR